MHTFWAKCSWYPSLEGSRVRTYWKGCLWQPGPCQISNNQSLLNVSVHYWGYTGPAKQFSCLLMQVKKKPESCRKLCVRGVWADWMKSQRISKKQKQRETNTSLTVFAAWMSLDPRALHRECHPHWAHCYSLNFSHLITTKKWVLLRDWTRFQAVSCVNEATQYNI